MKSSTPTSSPHKSADDRVRPETRAALLSALEHTPPLTRRDLEALTSLSPVTLRHACEALCREGILIRTAGQDPESGHACDLFSPVRAPILPLIELTDTHLLWRLFDTWGNPVATIPRERSTMHTLEDDVEYLFGRICALYPDSEALASAPPPCAPVLLTASPEAAYAEALIRRIWGHAPCLTLSPAEAAGQELSYHPLTGEDTCLLYWHIGTEVSGALLVRSNTDSPFFPSPHTADLSRALAAYVGNALPLSSPHTAGLAACLSDLSRFISLDHVVLDFPAHADENARTAVEKACHLGARPPLCFPASPGDPSLAHRGAIRLLRRALWASRSDTDSNY